MVSGAAEHLRQHERKGNAGLASGSLCGWRTHKILANVLRPARPFLESTKSSQCLPHTCINSTIASRGSGKEAFVSDHNGGNLKAHSGGSSRAALLRRTAETPTRRIRRVSSSRKMPYCWSRRSSSLTIGADYVRVSGASGSRDTEATGDALPVIRLFRACQAVFTGICILAVDFRLPCASQERRPTGIMMDMGVGSFVVGNAMISRLVLGRTWQPKRILPWWRSGS